MTSAAPPLKQEIELKDFKGDIFGTKFSLQKDSASGEVMFDYVELPPGFDVKKIKFFRVKGKDITTVETELRKLLKKEAPTAENKGKGAEDEFKKMTVEELALLDDIKIAEHISAGLAAKAYTAEEAEKLGKDAAAAKAAKAAGKGSSGNGDAAEGEAAEGEAAGEAAETAARAAEAAAEAGRKQGVVLALVNEFKRKESWINKGEEIDAFLAEKADQTRGDADLIAQAKAAILKAIADEPKVGVLAGEANRPAAASSSAAAAVSGPPLTSAEIIQQFKTFLGLTEAQNLAGKTEADVTRFLDAQTELPPVEKERYKTTLMTAIAGNAGAPAEGGKRTRRHKKQKKMKTRKHKK